MNGDARYAIVIPVYRNRDSVPELVRRLASLGESLDGPLQCVFVVDGSPDDSVSVLRDHVTAVGLRSRVLVLSRNYGSFAAIRTGLTHAQAEYVAVMAADLQEPVSVVVQFFAILRTGDWDVVIGERSGRDDPAVQSLSSSLYWRFYRRFVNAEMPLGGVDVFGCTRAVAQQLARFSERNTSLIGLLFWLGFRRTTVTYHRVAREHGTSGWTFSRKVRYLLDSVYAFTDLPILLVQGIGVLGLISSLLFGLIVLAAYVAGRITQPGYTPLIITMLASTSALLIGLGVVGSYVWRAYENTQGRPVAIVAQIEDHDGAGHQAAGTAGEKGA